MSELKPMEPHERYIAIGGESWGAALGNETSKWMTPKVGIFLYGADNRPMREQVEGMAFMSANAEMAMHPLLQIMQVIQERFVEFSKVNPKFKKITYEFQAAIDSTMATERIIEEVRKGK